MKVELNIAVADKEPTMAADDIRKREGDIIAVLEPDRPRGFKTLDAYLFVPTEIETSRSFQEAQQLLKMPYYEGGKVLGVDFGTKEYDVKPPVVAKNRYKISLSDLGDIDLTKTRDTSCIYQPFLRESAIVNWPYWNLEYLVMRYKGGVYEVRRTHKRQRKIHKETINGKVINFIRPKEPAIIVEVTEDESPWRPIYSNTATIGNNDEKIFEWSSTKNLIKDKHTDSYVGVQILG